MAKTSKGATNKRATIHDQKLARGNGGELHQFADGDIPVLTTAQGGPFQTIKIRCGSASRVQA